ncbi:MAG TPA: tRNA epoxyqueuosine(34) reductase QueG [Vicinamibacterales bacterium]|nr:tRNA epoxyqueuosine(34) reductase QueG [Vicinamibacterales bacterium]
MDGVIDDLQATLTSARIKAKALELGFDLCGVSAAVAHPKLARLATWIAEGRAGEMHYLADSLDERLDPRVFLPTARSVISLAVVYNSSAAPAPASTSEDEHGRASIARYARGDDYPDVLRARRRALVQGMADTHGPGLEALTCVDDGPVQERVFAEQAGLGWIGKHTCVINPKLGSWLFLAEIVTNAELECDRPAVDQCGTCTRCLDACPTGAIAEPYLVDATRCLSYLTIEQRGELDPSLRPAVREQIYGCDICQDVCPWNRRAATSDDEAWRPRDGLLSPKLIDLCAMTDGAWRPLLKGSAMRRAGLRRIRRSLAYATAHLEPDEAAAVLDAMSGQPSAQFPEVAEAIAWARDRRV